MLSSQLHMWLLSVSSLTDEDIPTMGTTPPIINGPITRSRAMRIHDQVNANLSLSFDLETMVVPSPPLLLVELRCDIEEGQTHFSLCKTMFYGEEAKLGIHDECVICWRNIVPILTKQCFARVSQLAKGSQNSSLLLKETFFDSSEQCLVENCQPPPTRVYQKLPH